MKNRHGAAPGGVGCLGEQQASNHTIRIEEYKNDEPSLLGANYRRRARHDPIQQLVRHRKSQAGSASPADRRRDLHALLRRELVMIEPNEVKEHYGAESLLARIDEAHRRAGIGDRSLGWADLVPVDQFHVRGLGATGELAESLGIDAGANVLDVCCGLGGPVRFLAATYACHVTGIDLSRPFVDAARMLTERAGLSDMVTAIY
jgi:2-polyprenyl-3-methyl-5-hydroxy-6-metoxy-1,4-benzoquinol methylase